MVQDAGRHVSFARSYLQLVPKFTTRFVQMVAGRFVRDPQLLKISRIPVVHVLSMRTFGGGCAATPRDARGDRRIHRDRFLHPTTNGHVS